MSFSRSPFFRISWLEQETFNKPNRPFTNHITTSPNILQNWIMRMNKCCTIWSFETNEIPRKPDWTWKLLWLGVPQPIFNADDHSSTYCILVRFAGMVAALYLSGNERSPSLKVLTCMYVWTHDFFLKINTIRISCAIYASSLMNIMLHPPPHGRNTLNTGYGMLEGTLQRSYDQLQRDPRIRRKNFGNAHKNNNGLSTL